MQNVICMEKQKQYLYKNTANKKTILLQIVPQIKEEFLFTGGGGPQRQKICIKNAT